MALSAVGSTAYNSAPAKRPPEGGLWCRIPLVDCPGGLLNHRRRPHLPAKHFGFIRTLPGKRRQLPPEMAVPGRFAVDRPPQVERFNNATRRQLEMLAN